MMAAEHPPGGSAGDGTHATSGDRSDPSAPAASPTPPWPGCRCTTAPSSSCTPSRSAPSPRSASPSWPGSTPPRSARTSPTSAATAPGASATTSTSSWARSGASSASTRAWSCLRGRCRQPGIGAAVLRRLPRSRVPRGGRWSTSIHGKVGTQVGGLTVAHQNEMARLIDDHDIAIGVIATPSGGGSGGRRRAGGSRGQVDPELRPHHGGGARGRVDPSGRPRLRAGDPRLPQGPARRAPRPDRSGMTHLPLQLRSVSGAAWWSAAAPSPPGGSCSWWPTGRR